MCGLFYVGCFVYYTLTTQHKYDGKQADADDVDQREQITAGLVDLEREFLSSIFVVAANHDTLEDGNHHDNEREGDVGVHQGDV